MNLKLKDYIVIAIVTLTSFPILYFIIMLYTGMARIDFGPQLKSPDEPEKVEIIKSSARKDSLAAVNSRIYQALQIEKTDIEKERKRLQDQQQRMDLMQQDIEKERESLQAERRKIETLVTQSDTLGKKKIRELAKTYEAMRAPEAAQIIETLSDKMAANVISAISDERQKGKILAALSTEKASTISKIIGSRP